MYVPAGVKTVYIIGDERGAPRGLSNGLGGLWLLIMGSVLVCVCVFVKEEQLQHYIIVNRGHTFT